MIHYLDVHLDDRQINTVVIHVGIKDILRDSSQSGINGLLQNIKNMSLKCKKYLYFGTSLYNQDKHWYFGKKSCYNSKYLPEIRLVLCR